MAHLFGKLGKKNPQYHPVYGTFVPSADRHNPYPAFVVQGYIMGIMENKISLYTLAV